MPTQKRKEKLKERILNEMVIEDIEASRLADEICTHHTLKEGYNYEDVYARIIELKKEMRK